MKRFISSALAASMILGSATFPSLASQFSDVNGHWGENAIERWLSYGIVEGDEHGNFNPDAVTSRAQMAQFLANLLNLKAKADISGYGDVNVNAWYADALSKCVAAGILKGTDEGLSPDAQVTREQAFVMFARAVGIDEQNSMNTEYPDSASVSDWAEGYINALINEGYVSGTGDGTIAPLATINRASIMQIFDNTIAHYANVPGTVLDVNESGLALVVADGVTVKGDVDTLVVTSKNVNLDGAKITNLEIVAADSSVSLSGGATVENANIAQAADGASLKVDKSSTVNSLVSDGENVTVSGEGAVKDAVVSGNNTAIDTTGTNLKVEEGVTGTTNNGSSVSGGTTVETKPSTPSTGGGNDSGGGETGPSYTTVNITENKTIDENTVIDSYTTWNVAEGVTLTVNEGVTVTVEGKLNVNGALTGGKVEIMKGGDVKIDANASKLPVSTEIKVNAGGVLSADSTSDGSRIEIIGDDSSSRINLTAGNAVFTFGEAGIKPQLNLNGTANVPASVTAYNHFGSEGDIIGIEMTVNGSFAVDGTFKVTSANGTVSGSAMTIAKGSTLTVNGTLSVASKGTVTNSGTMVVAGSFENNGTFNDTGTMTQEVSSAAQLSNISADTDTIKLTADLTTDSYAINPLLKGRTHVFDLNGRTLTVSSSQSLVVESNGETLSNITFKNGNLVLGNTTYTSANINILTGCSITVDTVNVTAKGSVLFPQGDAASVTVKDSTITTTGAYAVSTNAATTDNYNVVINISGTEINMNASNGDSCGLMINVAGTMNVSDTTVNGQRQAAIVRAGTACFDSCALISTPEKLDWVGKNMYSGTWGTGNEVPYGALIAGNQTSNSYLANADVTLIDCTLTTNGGEETGDFQVFAIYALRLNNDTYTTTVTGRGTNTITGRILNYNKTATLTNIQGSDS